MDTEDDIYLLSNYFLKRPTVPAHFEAVQEGTEKDFKDGEMDEEKGSMKETTSSLDADDKKDEEGSVTFSVDERDSTTSSIKAQLSGKTQTSVPRSL